MATVTQPGRHGDGNGLYLLVKPSGAKSWILRTVIRGRRCDIGLGGYPLVSLAEARTAAFDNRKLARAGGDPLALKRRPDIPVFEDAARTVIEIHKPTWRDGGKSAGQWEASLRQHVFPRLGTNASTRSPRRDVMGGLTSDMDREGRDRAPCSPAHRYGHEVGRSRKDIAPTIRPATLLQPHCRKLAAHAGIFRAIHHIEARDAIRAVRESQASLAVRLAFEFLVLTAARSGEVRSALWSEMNIGAATWTIPGERMKSGREHRVPLSERALAILDEARVLDDGSGLVFPAPAGRRPMSDSTLSKLLREVGIEAVPHGFRSTFRDWCSESARVPREVAEACLAHVVTGVEGAYARSDLLDHRRKLMERWAAYLAADTDDTVIPMVRSSKETGR